MLKFNVKGKETKLLNHNTILTLQSGEIDLAEHKKNSNYLKLKTLVWVSGYISYQQA